MESINRKKLKPLQFKKTNKKQYDAMQNTEERGKWKAVTADPPQNTPERF